MKIKSNMIICFVIALALMTIGTAAAAGTIIVDDNLVECPSADYREIQDAVSNAADGDTIIVYPGTYTENVNVNKELTIISQSGNPEDTIVQTANPNDHVFYVTADNVTVSGFNVTDATGTAGVYLNGVANCTITNNSLSNNWYGTYLWESSNNTLTNNIASNNWLGIALDGSNNNKLTNNIASNNDLGIGLDGSSNNTLTNNTVKSNNYYGIYLGYSSNRNTLNNNIASNNDDGIDLEFSDNNTLSNNTANSNNDNGIVLYYCSNNTLTNNIASNNDNGIVLDDSSDNTLSNNIASNNEFGIYLIWSSNNTLTNNTANSNSCGIYLELGSSNNTLTNNTANSNNDYGFLLQNSNNNTLKNNNASNNFSGIWLSYSSNNTLTNNTVNSNDYEGICLWYSSDNLIYNNYFKNTNNAYIDNSAGNVWNTTKTPGINIVGGTYLGGNYWAKTDGTGFSQTCNDANGDGLCDSSYNIDENNIDYLPLSIPFDPMSYDANSNGVIEKNEVMDAINDYFAPGSDMTKAEVMNVINIFFEKLMEEPEPDQPTSDETIRVGAFNVQVFGISKASDPEVMDILADIIRTYDVIAVQEIRDKSQTALPALVDEVNSDGSQYDYVVSERLGRTISKEQYAYIYNTQTIELTGIPHTYPEPSGTDPFHREPYITSFNTLNGNFDAVLITIHTDPDEATEEINTLDDVVEYTKSTYPGEQDFMIIGDLNADGSYFDENSASDISGSEYAWIIDNSQDTTTKSTDYTYDRIIITDTSDFADESGVLRFDIEYGLNYDETVSVSDHYPVYAEFYCNKDDDASSASVLIPSQ